MTLLLYQGLLPVSKKILFKLMFFSAVLNTAYIYLQCAIGFNTPDTIVRISPTDFPRLSEESAVNCNRTYETSLSELTQKIDDGGRVFFERLPRSVVSAIVSGVLMSNQVEAGHKKLLI